MWAAAPGHLRRIQWSTRHDRKYLMWTEKYFMLTKNTSPSQLSAIFSDRKYLLAEPNCCDHEKYFDCEAKENTPAWWRARSQRETRCEDSQMMIWHLAVVFSSYRPAASSLWCHQLLKGNCRNNYSIIFIFTRRSVEWKVIMIITLQSLIKARNLILTNS